MASQQPKEVFFDGPRHVNPIPAGVRANGFIFLSAVRGQDPESRVLAPDAAGQARQLFANLQAVLGTVGAGLEHVVRMGVFMADLEHDRAAFNEVWQAHFGDQPPARFAIQISGMGMPGDGTRFLADVIALDPNA